MGWLIVHGGAWRFSRVLLFLNTKGYHSNFLYIDKGHFMNKSCAINKMDAHRESGGRRSLRGGGGE